ncbi:hypothetical protein C454_11176 [Haloferax gibbonsii ATCC 33959]|uniref:Uncharacterized protein n=1 Tax=Haloferax gibbonsii (strain ATCC 33959 / DSM 4427 / JCM 8863 / NBRC 102184 / NCIMB 2188 / Ma 2.38) TaxID=1227459 RepID=M0HAL8_HALGM|nr:hypothetical protein [Haloferax gibbonsii]ELZ80169.1 hypothetical protein C454_11176 [Haloferax gibbonsii ATCC 33959]
MTEDEKDFTELSDEEISELSDDFVEGMREAVGIAFGSDVFGDIDENEKEDLGSQIENLLLKYREAMSKDSEEERAIAMYELYDEFLTQNFMAPEDEGEFDSGVEVLVGQIRDVLEGNRKGLEEIGYAKYYDLMDEFAREIVEEGKLSEVKSFLDSQADGSQEMILQRLMNPVFTDYHEYIEDHPEITDDSEARKYAEMYYELAELTKKYLPHFIAVLQIVHGRENTYDKLNQMSLNNLLQKLESKKYERFNDLANGIDRKLRNSIAHRDFKINPIKKEIEFYDREELVAELNYSEFQNKVFHILAVFNAVWVFQLMLRYYRIQHLPRAFEELREEIEE